MNRESSDQQPFLNQLGELIDQACKNGETVSDIAMRAGLSRDLVSRLRNRSYRSAPSLLHVEAVCNAIGHRLTLEPISNEELPNEQSGS